MLVKEEFLLSSFFLVFVAPNVAKFDDFDVSGEVVLRQFLHSCDVCTHVSNSLILAAFFSIISRPFYSR